MSRTEHADARSHRGTFPTEWGYPVGAPDSEERAEWIKANVRRHGALTAHRRLADKQGRLLAILRRAELHEREEGPR